MNDVFRVDRKSFSNAIKTFEYFVSLKTFLDVIDDDYVETAVSQHDQPTLQRSTAHVASNLTSNESVCY